MQYKYVVLTNTTIGAFMAILDSNIVLIALPTITSDLKATPFEAVWIIMGYILVTASLLMSFGRLSDIFGRVRLYNIGFALFTVGSALCSVAPNGTALVLFRLLQGSGGALIFSNAAALLTDVFPATERGRALGLNQVAGAVGSVVGLALGGVLAGSFLGWRSIFWINIPVGTFATVWAHFKLKETSEKHRGDKLDPLGNLLFSGGLTVFLVGLMLGALIGWASEFLGLMALGLIMVGGFVFVETKVRFPMMDLSLFRIRAFAAGMASNLLASMARGGLSLVLVFYLQGVLLLDAFTAGLWLIPFSVAFVSFGPLSGYLSDKVGSRGLATGGLLVTAAALFWLGLLPLPLNGAGYLQLLVPMVLAGAGGGLFVAPNVASIMNATPAPRRGIASGMSSTLFNTGFLLSLGLAFAVMAANVPQRVLQAIFSGTSGGIGTGLQDKFVGSIHGLFLILAFVSLFGAVPAFMTKKRGGGHAAVVASAAE